MKETKRGGYRQGSGAKPKPPAEVASVRIVANVTQSEAAEWQRRGRTGWLRDELRSAASLPETDLDRMLFALKTIRHAGRNDHPTAIWMQKTAAHAMEPEKWPKQPDEPPH